MLREGTKAGKRIWQRKRFSRKDAEWFTTRDDLPENRHQRYSVTGETNTDDLSPAPDAWSRPDIPLHALAMLKMPRDGIVPDNNGEVRTHETYRGAQSKGHPWLTWVMSWNRIES